MYSTNDQRKWHKKLHLGFKIWTLHQSFHKSIPKICGKKLLKIQASGTSGVQLCFLNPQMSLLPPIFWIRPRHITDSQMARIPLGVPEVSLLKTPEVAKLLRPHHQMPNVPLLDGSLWDPSGGEVDDESFFLKGKEIWEIWCFSFVLWEDQNASYESPKSLTPVVCTL